MPSKKSAPTSHPAVTPSTPSPLLGGSQSKEIPKTNGSTRTQVTNALNTPLPPITKKRNGTPPILQELNIPDTWDDEILPSEEDLSEEHFDADVVSTNPFVPTKAKPGSEEKVLEMAARFAAGMPLWHNGDVTDLGPATKAEELSAIAESSTKAKGRPSDAVRQGGLASETEEETIDDDEDDADEL